MNFAALKSTAIRSGSKALLQGRKHSPEILVGAGVVALIGAGVLAARSTLKLEKTIDKAADRTDKAKQAVAEGAHTREITKAYVANSVDMLKLYGPSLSLGILGATAIFSGYRILHTRNVALVGAYKMLEQSTLAYRERVREEVGEEKEKDLYLGIKEVSEKNPETGKVEKFKQGVDDPSKLSPYARFFDEGNPNWKRETHDLNFHFLRTVQDYATQRLQSRGYLFLNEVLKDLGFEQTGQGSLVGWIITPDSDGYVDFGMYNTRNSAFVNGDERSILIDFNVDGLIFDKVDDIVARRNAPRALKK